MIEKKLTQLEKECITSISQTQSVQGLETIRVQFLGKKGALTQLLKDISTLPIDKRPLIGKLANQVKSKIATHIDKQSTHLQDLELTKTLSQDTCDPTLPAPHSPLGTRHPLSQTITLVCDLFSKLGYSIQEGPDIESEDYNFDKLNIPSTHPARDMHDTFYLSDAHLLRTHTSPVQIRTMLTAKPPLRILAPGKVYRCDADTSHSPVFHQIEGLYVDTNVTFADLKGTLEHFLHALFGKERKVRFRPSYFPFTEPSTEVDVECFKCKGNGCSLCKQTGWLEILGAGMVHQNVFTAVNYDPKTITGFAFGMGIERIAMLLYHIHDIRLFYENDTRFLRQF